MHNPAILARAEELMKDKAFVSAVVQSIGPLCADMLALSLVEGKTADAGAFLSGMIRGSAISAAMKGQ